MRRSNAGRSARLPTYTGGSSSCHGAPVAARHGADRNVADTRHEKLDNKVVSNHAGVPIRRLSHNGGRRCEGLHARVVPALLRLKLAAIAVAASVSQTMASTSRWEVLPSR